MVEALELFSADFDGEIWRRAEWAVPAASIESIVEVLDEGARAPVLEGFLSGRYLKWIEAKQDNHQVVVTLLDWSSPEAARHFVEAERSRMEAGDGEIWVERAEYRDVETSGLVGYIGDKTLRDMFGPYGAHSIVVARGKTLVEVVFLAEDKSDAELVREAAWFFAALGVAAP
jgi:heme-degrading monooxygenase HmoA